MADEGDGSIDLSLLSWVEGAVGPSLLAYLLGVEVEALPAVMGGDVPLDGKQAEVAGAFAALKAAMPAELDSSGEAEVIRAWLTRSGQEDGASVAGVLHGHVVGDDEALPSCSSDLETALTTLARDCYPAFLMSPDPLPVKAFFVELPSARVMSILLWHPQSAVLALAVSRDAVLKRAFGQRAEQVRADGATDHGVIDEGSSFQSSLFARMVLSSAWRHIESEGRSPGAFMAQALRELHFMRDALAGKSQPITAKLGLMGVLLPAPTTRLKLPDGVVRAATGADHRLTPENLKGKLKTTDSSGNSVVVNYDGDLVFECQVPYKINLVNEPGDGGPRLLADAKPPVDLDEVLLRLRFSLMLAVEREHRVQIVPTWRYLDEPIGMGLPLGWPDTRQSVGIVPVQLTEAEVAAWGEWYARLSTPHVARIGLALSRILRALAERREPSDVLIDSVIAWENLFGTKEGEPTFRISTCLAVLLEDSFQARVLLKKKLTDIYSLRSKIVHGSRNLKADEHPQCQEALDFAIKAVRLLASTRTDILELPDGAARSSALLLGASPEEDTDGQPEQA